MDTPSLDTAALDTAALARSILDTHHALLHRELPRLAAAFREAPKELRAPFLRLKQVMDEHMMKEERILFPLIITLGEGGPNGGCGVDGPIAQMGVEHHGIRLLEDELRGVASLAGPEEEALMELLDDLSEHARKEDDTLFPAALALARAAAARPPRVDEGDGDEGDDDEGDGVTGGAVTRGAVTAGAVTAGAERGGVRLEHLGQSGLRLHIGGATLAVDAPVRVDDPLVVTWTERERVEGARADKAGGSRADRAPTSRARSGGLAASPAVLAWLGCTGTVIAEGWPTSFHGFLLQARPFTPIPYATAPEALRKTWSALRAPARAFGRVAFTLGRPDTPPLVLTIERSGLRVALLSQALHRFLRPNDLAALVLWAGALDLVVAGTDYDDEAATGEMIGAFDARTRVIADLTGSIRRTLGLPVRPLEVALRAAPPGTLLLEVGGAIDVPAARSA